LQIVHQCNYIRLTLNAIICKIEEMNDAWENQIWRNTI
jgi:hypothetical protein